MNNTKQSIDFGYRCPNNFYKGAVSRLLLLTVFIILHSVSSQAQSSIVIPEMEGSVTLDGIINEASWMNAAQFELIMHNPNNNVEPTEFTTAYIMYDDRFIYIAGKMSDKEAYKIQSPTKKRDDIGLNNDWFGVFLDTFNDKENALAFTTTPSGLRTDYQTFNDAQGSFPINVDWNTFWDVEVNQNEDGWA